MFQKETLFILSLSLFSSLSWAAPHRSSLNPELIEAYNQVKSEKENIQLSELIPAGLEQMDSNQAVRSIADRGLSEWWRASGARESSLGRHVEKAEKIVDQEIHLGSADSEIKHKILFQVNAFQTKAEMQYSGYSNANIYYQASSSVLGMEVSENIFNQNVVLSHQLKPDENFSQMSLNWSW